MQEDDAQKKFRSIIDGKVIIDNNHEAKWLLASQMDITRIWVPGHRDIEGNKRADDLLTQTVTVVIKFLRRKQCIISYVSVRRTQKIENIASVNDRRMERFIHLTKWL